MTMSSRFGLWIQKLSWRQSEHPPTLATHLSPLRLILQSCEDRLADHRPSRSSTAELEPNMTFRGHTAPITSLAISSSHEPLIFSASLDSTIRVWRIPPTSHSPYASYDSSFTVQTLEAHTDAIWDLLLIPSPFRSASPKKDGSANSNAQSLVSISADSSLRIWNEAEDGKWFADRVYSVDVTPTCLSVYHPDPTKVLVGLSDGRMRLWDAQDGLTQTWQGGM